jgi:hypothetical protein
MNDYFVSEQPGNRARIHLGTCRYCNNGMGVGAVPEFAKDQQQGGRGRM